MIEWVTVIGLVFFGLGLVIIEIIFIPGTTFVGLGGVAFAGLGIYLSYQYFGSTIGSVVLISAAGISVVTFVISIRSGVWRKFALNKAMNSKVNEGLNLGLQIGEQGKALSALRPIGKGEFGERVLEVSSMGNYVEVGQKIQIIKIDINKILVEQIKEE